MKHGIAPKNAVETDSMKLYFWFCCKAYKNFSIWFVKPLCFATPKLHFATPNGIATPSLRSPGLVFFSNVNLFKFFLRKACSLWNSLPAEIKSSPSHKNFVKRLKFYYQVAKRSILHYLGVNPWHPSVVWFASPTVHQPFQSRVRHVSCRVLQSYNPPGDWARELFKHSTVSASLVVEIEKKFFSFLVGGFRGERHKGGWLHLPGSGPQPIGPLLWFKIFSETRLKSASSEPLNDFLAYL